MGIDIIGFCMA